MKSGGDTPVCICDDNYCDEYPDIPNSLIRESNTIVQISTSKAGERFRSYVANFTWTCSTIPPPFQPQKPQNPPTPGYNEHRNDNTNYSKYSLNRFL